MSELVDREEYCIPEEHDFQNLNFIIKFYVFIVVTGMITVVAVVFGQLLTATIGLFGLDLDTKIDTYPPFLRVLYYSCGGFVVIFFIYYGEKTHRNLKKRKQSHSHS